MPMFTALPESLTEIRGFIRDRARAAEFSGDSADDLALAVSEACANVIVHSGSRRVRVTWRALADGVEVRVEDEGCFDSPFPLPELGGAGQGFGLPLMMALVDEFALRPGTKKHPGTAIRLFKRLAS